MKRKKLGDVIVVALPFLLALVVDLVLFVAFRDRLPGRMAEHFGIDGRADGYMGQAWHAVLGSLLFAVTGVLWTGMVVKGRFYGRAHRLLVAAGYAFAGFMGWLLAAVLFANVDAVEDAAGRAQGVSLPLWQIAAALAAAAVAFGLGTALAALTPVPAPPAGAVPVGDGARIALAEGEVAGWARGTGGWWMPLLALGLVAVGVVLLLASGWAAGIPPLVLGVLLTVFARPHVVVDRRGITISGLLPWPRLRVPLDRIETATSRDIKPLAEYGGWGYRVRPGRSGLMIRSGEGIVATLVGGRDFAVTVDDSATGAALLNTLIDQRRAER
ncbi:DUF1648 domain-containing protein [Streptomyces sp. NPDC014734]|uniref:DUF1648 domain-containing protein n=1 Tax=Streptomyces sp. NPDC014734 TaxID=3364886 RepID=UPI0036FC0BDD